MSSKTLTEAVAKAQLLPEFDQDRIGRDLNDYVDGLRRLRAELERGVRSLDAGFGKELDVESVITRANAEHAKPQIPDRMVTRIRR
jgi:hypothetical protein